MRGTEYTVDGNAQASGVLLRNDLRGLPDGLFGAPDDFMGNLNTLLCELCEVGPRCQNSHGSPGAAATG